MLPIFSSQPSPMLPTSIPTSKQILWLVALFTLFAILFFQQSLIGINIFDEGFIISGAMLINDGKLPYRDFLSMYGPGQYYVTAALFSVLGENLLFARYLHVILISALGITIFVLAKRSTPSFVGALLIVPIYMGIVLFARPSIAYPAITATLFLLLSAIAVDGWAETFRLNKIALASCLVGIAGLFRWDFGIFGLVALTLIVALAMMQKRTNPEVSTPVFSWFIAVFAPAVVILASAYIPLLVIFSDPIRWYHEVPLFSLIEFAKWRNSHFVTPAIHDVLSLGGLLSNRGAISFDGSTLKQVYSVIHSSLQLAYLGIPLLLVIIALGTGAHACARNKVNPVIHPKLLLILYLALLCLFLLNQMRVRPGLWQGFPAVVASLPLIILLWNYYKPFTLNNAPLHKALKITGWVIVAMLFIVGAKVLLVPAIEPHTAFDTSRSSFVLVKPEQKPYLDLVKYIQANTKPDEPIYSGVQDHSRLFINDAMLYFLSNRQPADRFLELEPGISNTESGQEEIISALKQKSVKLIVLSDILSNEPNNTSTSNGVTVLDEFIRANYHFDKNFGNQMVFVKN